MGLPYGTLITSLTDCYVVGAGWYWGGGVVTCRGYVPFFHAIEDIYYQHLVHINVHLGQHLAQMDDVGLSNSWIEWGINPHWYGIWGPFPHPGPWINPLYSGYAAFLQLPVLHPQIAAPIPMPPTRTHMVIITTPSVVPTLHPEQLANAEYATNLDINVILVLGGLFILSEILVIGFLFRKRFIT